MLDYDKLDKEFTKLIKSFSKEFLIKWFEQNEEALRQPDVIKSVCSFCGFPKIIWHNSSKEYVCGKCGKTQEQTVL